MCRRFQETESCEGRVRQLCLQTFSKRQHFSAAFRGGFVIRQALSIYYLVFKWFWNIQSLKWVTALVWTLSCSALTLACPIPFYRIHQRTNTSDKNKGFAILGYSFGFSVRYIFWGKCYGFISKSTVVKTGKEGRKRHHSLAGVSRGILLFMVSALTPRPLGHLGHLNITPICDCWADAGR